MATYDLKYPGAAIDAILDTAYDLQNAGYIFRGLASEYSNTPTERSWVLAGEGETGHGFTSPVPKGYIGVCVFNGTSWTGKLLKCVSIDSTPTNGSTNALSSGGAYASISQLADTVNEALDNLTFTDTTPSAFLGEYITEKVSTTDGGLERILTYFTILAATTSKAGLLSAADKAKLDAILGNLRSLEIDDTTAYADLGDKIVESIKATIGGTEETISTFQLLAATASKAGLLSAADKAKLDALWTSGYQFAGIATPSTTPISTTSKIFYIATEAGTYFNAVTITQGINILSWDGTSWSAVQVVGIDDEPTAGSSNLVESGGVHKIVQDISKLILKQPTSIMEGKRIKLDDTIEDFTGRSIHIYPVEAGKDYAFSIRSPKSDMIVRILAWYDDNGDFVEHSKYVNNNEEAVVYTNEYVAAPAGASYAYFTVVDNQQSTELNKLKFYESEIVKSSDLSKKTGELNAIVSHSHLLDFVSDTDGFITESGEHTESERYIERKYAVTGGNSYTFSGKRSSGHTVIFLAWFDSEDNFLLSEPYKGDLNNAVEYKNQYVVAPKQAAYAILNIDRTGNYASHGFYSVGDYMMSNSIEENVLVNKSVLSDYIQLPYTSTTDGQFMNISGSYTSLSSFKTEKYTVVGGKNYRIKGFMRVANAGIHILYWLDSQQRVIFNQFRTYLTDEEDLYVDEIVTAPDTAEYAVINIRKENAVHYALYAIGNYISSKELLDMVNEKANVSNLRKLVKLEPSEITSGWYNFTADEVRESSSFKMRKYAVTPSTMYYFSAASHARTTVTYLGWFDENDELLYGEPYKGSMVEDVWYMKEPVTSPNGAAYALLNVNNGLSGYFDFYSGGDIINMEELAEEVEGLERGNLKVVLNSDQSFYVRGKIDGTHDGILTFLRDSKAGFNGNCCIEPRYFYIGNSSAADTEIMASGNSQRCNDVIMGQMSLTNIGPVFGNHGLCTPRVTIEDHGLTDSDIGTEWTDQNDWHYTIVRISGNNIYLMPVMYNAEDPMLAYREWKDYHSEYPTQITRNGVTLTVDSSARYDYQVSEMEDIKVLIDGVEKESGTFYCNEIQLSYRQVCYNPFSIETWAPSVVYEDVMAHRYWQFTVTGSSGFISVSMSTLFDVKEDFPSNHATAIGVMEPLKIGDYDCISCIPKVKKTGLDGERITNVDTGSSTSVYRDSSDLYDVNDIPDRMYAYLKDDSDNILFGCAGGLSLVRGMSKPTVRRGSINSGDLCMQFAPTAGNKNYFTLNRNITTDTSYLEEREIYMCWYKPDNDIQNWFYKSGNDYILYIHTKSSHTKEAVNVSTLLNGLEVKEVIESKGDIEYLNSIITDGKIYINSGSGYEYLVLRIG